MTKKQNYSAPETDVLELQTGQGLCVISPNLVLTEFLSEGSYEEL